MNREYLITLKEDHRVDVFLQNDFRLIGTITKITETECTLLIQQNELTKKKLINFHVLNPIKAIYYGEDDVYGFKTDIVKFKADSTLLILKRPTRFYKVQQRQHIRTSCYVKAILTEDLNEKNQIEGTVLNLSGGGMELKVCSNIIGNLVHVSFDYKGEHYHYRAIKRRVQEVNELGILTYRLGLEFIDVEISKREQTIKLVLDKKRETQRKRLG